MAAPPTDIPPPPYSEAHRAQDPGEYMFSGETSVFVQQEQSERNKNPPARSYGTMSNNLLQEAVMHPIVSSLHIRMSHQQVIKFISTIQLQNSCLKTMLFWCDMTLLMPREPAYPGMCIDSCVPLLL